MTKLLQLALSLKSIRLKLVSSSRPSPRRTPGTGRRLGSGFRRNDESANSTTNRRTLVAVLILFASPSVLASEKHSPVASGMESGDSVAEDYCNNIIDKAADARSAWQLANLQKLEKNVSDKLALLENKQQELQEWISKREQMLKMAGRELVDIYAKMDPDAAAGQLAKLDSATATSILRQLPPRAASAILDVMEADLAAGLVSAIAAATREAAPEGGT